MRAARSPAVIVIVLTIGISVLVATLTTPAHQCHARSLFKVDIKETGRWPDLSGADANPLRLLLDIREGRRLLAKASAADETEFAFRKIGPVRNTSLGCLEYSGVNSNLVERVASNAASMVVGFYATNQPGWDVTYIRSYCFTPPPLGERLRRFLGL